MPWRWSGTARPQTKDMQRAQNNLGLMYRDALAVEGGLPQSDALAVEWYRKAADQGDAQAQHNLGLMYDRARVGCLRVMPWRWSGTARPQTKEMRRRQSRGHVRGWQGCASE